MKIFPIRYKISILIIILIGTVIFPAMFSLVRKEKDILTKQFQMRGLALIENFSTSIGNAMRFGDLGLDDIAEEIKNKNNALNIYVIANNSVYMVHSDYTNVGKTHKSEELIIDGFGSMNFYLAYNKSINKYVYKFFKPVKELGEITGIAYVELDYDEINREINKIIFRIIIIFVIVLLIGIIGSMILGHWIAHPIHILTEGVKITAKGDLNYKIKLETNDEINILKNEFNIMTVKLKQAQEIKLKQQRIEQELKIASEIQRILIPSKLPDISFDTSFYYSMARDVGGDYYDFEKIDNNKTAFIIADVTGKGVPAALVMTMTKSLFRTSIYEKSVLKDIMLIMNNSLFQDTKPNMFVTSIIAVINEKNKSIEFFSAGHEPLLYFSKKNNKFIDVKTAGIPLGLMNNDEFEKSLNISKLKLNSGDIILFYTDGLTDTENDEGDFFELSNIKETIFKNKQSNAKALISKIRETHKNFMGTMPQKDDLTLVLFKC